MKIISWNINSVRLRIKQLDEVLKLEKPDIICLQETKVRDEEFPHKKIHAMGYKNIYISGEKSYNGVAIISKAPLSDIEIFKIAGSNDCRHIKAKTNCGIELHNFYIPAGGDEPDTELNPKYKFKIDFLNWIDEYFSNNRDKSDKIVIVGDFNIAPLEHDVWSSKQLRNVVSHTALERETLAQFNHNLQWIDTARFFTPEDEKSYSWWSYRNRDWKKSNRGRRLDHIWTTPALKNSLKSYKTLIETRDWEKPSDHVPIILEFNA